MEQGHTTLTPVWSRIRGIQKYPNFGQLEEIGMYIWEGRKTGSFLQAVISNDLKEAVTRADASNKAVLTQIVGWMYAYAPHNCWGSSGLYERWVRSGGLVGLNITKEGTPQ